MIESDPEKAHLTARGPVDLMIVNATAKAFDGLRFAAQIRSDEATRHLPILGVDRPRRPARGWSRRWRSASTTCCRGRSIPQELPARARSQIKRKRYTDFLRNNLDHSLELAVTDQLTGLHNRRYMTGQLGALVERAMRGGEPVAALMIDIDHFKKINDSFGHDVGDEVLREFAVRLASNVRAIDLPCRYGGEEFVVIMPDTTLADAAPHRRAHPPARGRLAVPRRRRQGTADGDHLDRRRRHPGRQTTPPRRCSSAPTRRSTKPRPPAATRSSPKRRSAKGALPSRDKRRGAESEPARPAI